ncbi:hypothetical protein [Paraburkholderia sp. BCC1884]|uniref:hypothetical protein n=1 Tax=Paraburkholderia sp. BCC1884 TaxID=2562668 RepID=UPI0011827B9A|nr:hypothetical protein [Paraburkholderia sp. BCC1884]
MKRIIFAAVFGVFVDSLVIRAGATMSARLLLAPFLGALSLTACGEWILARMRVTLLVTWLPAAFVTGTMVTSIAIFGLTLIGTPSAQSAFIIWTMVVALAWIVWRPPSMPQSGSWLDVGTMIGFAALCAYFCRSVAGFLPTAPSGGALLGWSDLYLHGTVIASFGDALALTRGDIFLADAARPFYHYGPFMLPAALLPSTGLPGVGLATSVLLPFGLLIAALGAHVFVAELAGEGAALVAVLAVAIFPDASVYGMYNGFFGFHWLLITAPGSGYALGGGLVACTCLMYSLRTGDRLPLIAAFFLLALLFLTRVHFFMLLAPAMIGVAILTNTKGGARRRVLWGGVFIIAVASAAVAISPAIRTAWTNLVEPAVAIDTMLASGPEHFRQLFRVLITQCYAFALLAGISMMLAAALGIFLVGYPMVAAWRCRSEHREAIDLLPLLLCGSFAALWLIAPVPAASDASEYKQRHFILLYAVVALWVLARLLQARGDIKLNTQSARFVGWCAFMGVIAATMVFGKDANPGAPAAKYMDWASQFYGQKIIPGIAQVAAYIRSNSRPGDTLVMAGEPIKDPLTGPLVELVSLSDVPAYLSRTDLLLQKGGTSATLANLRSAQINQIVQSADWTLACNAMRRSGIRWYVGSDNVLPAWSLGRAHAVFRSGEFSVYDAGGPHVTARCDTASN